MTSSSSSFIAGSTTHDGSSIGSVNSPTSAPPVRSCRTSRGVAPVISFDLHARMRVLELLQQRRQHVQTHGHPAGDAKRPAQLLVLIANLFDGVGEILEQPVAQLDELLSRARRRRTTPLSQEQRLAELLFEQQHLTADRRLRHVQLFARPGERPGLGNGAEDLELAQVHVTAALRDVAGRPPA